MSEPTPSERLLNAKKEWDRHYPALPATVASQQNTAIPKESLDAWWAKAIRELEMIEYDNAVDLALKPFHWPNVVSNVQNIENHMSAAKSNGADWLASTSPTLQSYLHTIISSTFWLVPFSAENLTRAAAQKIADLAHIGEQMRGLGTVAIEREAQLHGLAEKAEAIVTAMTAHREQAESTARSLDTALTNSTASAAATEGEKSKAEDAVKELLDALIRQAALFKEFEEKRALVDSTLEGASKVGLAKSFNTRRASLDRIQWVWAGVFVAGIVGLFFAGWFAWSGMREALDPQNRQASNGLFLWASLSRYVLVAPIIWLTWFAARQYGHALRLAEDYAFKEAAALAFVGYRTEMAEDEDMLKLLREYAIKNFGANPVRVLAHDDPVSPVNAALERALEKVNPDKLIDLIKDAITKAK